MNFDLARSADLLLGINGFILLLFPSFPTQSMVIGFLGLAFAALVSMALERDRCLMLEPSPVSHPRQALSLPLRIELKFGESLKIGWLWMKE